MTSSVSSLPMQMVISVVPIIMHLKVRTTRLWYDKAVADFNQALKVAQKKDDVYYNIGKLMYAYQLSKPEKLIKTGRMTLL